MPKLSAEKETNLFLSEMVLALKENTNVLQQNLEETRKLSEMLSPTLKKSEAVKLKKMEGKNLLNDCLKTIRGTNA
tara:strand:+ start:88 stop:315 length:228 start_codon:yes stop_codon:yes gene_type:complete